MKPQTLQRGSLQFRLYTQRRRRNARRTYTSYILAWRLNGRRHRLVRARRPDCLAQLAAIETAIANGQTDALAFTATDRALLQRLRELGAGCGAPLELLVAEAVAARARLARTSLVCKTCPEILAELLAAKRAEGAGPRWIADLDSRLGRFARAFPGPLAEVRADELRTWLTRLNLSRRSWNNNRTALLALAAFAREHRYLPAEWQELAAVKPFKLAKPEEDLYAPEQLRSLLFTAEKHYPQHLPALAVMALAGCRHSELRDAQAALDWQDVHLDSAQIHIREAVAKSNTGRRYVPVQPALAEWLQLYRRPRGPVCPARNLTNALARIAARAGVPWKRNALRNSYISYRCALTKNVAEVAAEAGNSVGEIHKSYRREIPAAEAARWFDIHPTLADVLPLFANVPL